VLEKQIASLSLSVNYKGFLHGFFNQATQLLFYECSAFSAIFTLYRSLNPNKHKDMRQTIQARLMTQTVVTQTILQKKKKKEASQLKYL